jgi:hypothetical protein
MNVAGVKISVSNSAVSLVYCGPMLRFILPSVGRLFSVFFSFGRRNQCTRRQKQDPLSNVTL